MSAVYFKPNVHSAINGFDIDREKEKSKHFHINWAYWYEECWDNECKQIKIHIQHEGPYWFATKFNLHIVLECDPKEDSDYDSEEDLITEKFRIDNLEEPQVFTINLLDSSVSVDSIYAEISILDTGCITFLRPITKNYANKDQCR